ncbi:MAG TPA: hypothetical protein VII52_14005 [Gemmatimonadaceae bacterium]
MDLLPRRERYRRFFALPAGAFVEARAVDLNDPSRPATLDNPAAVDGGRFDSGAGGLSAGGRDGDAGAGFITRNAGGLPMCGGSGRRPNAPARLERGIFAIFGCVVGSATSDSFCMNGHIGIGMRL